MKNPIQLLNMHQKFKIVYKTYRPSASSASNQVTSKQISGLRTGPAYNLVELCNVIEGTAFWAVGLAGSVA